MARNPGSNYQTPEAISQIDIDFVPDFDICDYNLSNPKELFKFLKRVEKVCRSSYEYREFINFLRDYGDMNQCSFMKYITNAEDRGIKIEIHHEPITLFDIVKTVVNKKLSLGEYIDEEMVAKEVMWNHYKMHVGLIPLSETVHEMVHNQYLFIPTQAVFGKWRQFIEDYKPYVDEQLINTLEEIDKKSETYDFDEQTKILAPGIVQVNVQNPQYQPSVEELYSFSKEMLDQADTNMMKTK